MGFAQRGLRGWVCVAAGSFDFASLSSHAGAWILEVNIVRLSAAHSLNGVSHPKQINAPITTISTKSRIRKGSFARSCSQKQS